MTQQSATLDPQRILRGTFGYETFRTGQLQLVDAALAGSDCLGVMPTGSGKSLCYQVPALAFAQEGRAPTIVVSPLVSLMNDQVSALVAAGVHAAYLNSQLTVAQQWEVLDRAAAGAYSLMYVAPERLDDPRFVSFASSADIPLIAVDEAHCVSQWGQDFRPSYLGIADFINGLPRRPVVAAFTATATPKVADDIVRLLGLRDPVRVATGFDRPNLQLQVEQLTDKRKLARVASYALDHPADSGIVYCSTRKQVESLCEALQAAGVSATRYHAGLGAQERTRNQRDFVNDDAPVMVATNAFGMGIDKSNVRYVIHYNMPGSLEAYYQEAGRAGRDGEPATCLLMWNDSDIATARFFIEQETQNEAMTAEETEIVRASQRRRLSAMVGYCMTTDCLRATILRYFGDDASGVAGAPKAASGEGQTSVPEAAGQGVTYTNGCGNCSNCDGNVDAVDVTKTARSVMRCVHELRGRFGKGVVADVLCGSKSAKIREWGLDRARTYDIVDEPGSVVKEIIELLTAGEYLEISEGRYPLVGLGPRARQAATDEFRLYMKRIVKPVKQVKGAGSGSKARTSKAAAQLQTDDQKALFERLRQLRKRIADAEGVPPYIVFSDATLRALCVAQPASVDELLDVPGIGPAKLSRYGEAFFAELQQSS